MGNPLDELKGFDAGRTLALIKKLGGRKNAELILSDDYTIELKKKFNKLFDKDGRRIPQGLISEVRDANKTYYLNQPEMKTIDDYVQRLNLLIEVFTKIWTESQLKAVSSITAEGFKEGVECLITMIKSDLCVANIMKGVWLPIILPQLFDSDLGNIFEWFAKGAGESYLNHFEKKDVRFCNYFQLRLSGNITVADSSRHEQLIERMRQGPVLGIHFSNSLQGFSASASKEQLLTLPEGFILSGLDTPIAMAMYPDILMRDHDTPALCMPSIVVGSIDDSLTFKTHSDSLCLDEHKHFRYKDSMNCGLLFIAPKQ